MASLSQPAASGPAGPAAIPPGCLGECPPEPLRHAGGGDRCGGVQPDGKGNRLLVVEHQRWEALRPRPVGSRRRPRGAPAPGSPAPVAGRRRAAACARTPRAGRPAPLPASDRCPCSRDGSRSVRELRDAKGLVGEAVECRRAHGVRPPASPSGRRVSTSGSRRGASAIRRREPRSLRRSSWRTLHCQRLRDLRSEPGQTGDEKEHSRTSQQCWTNLEPDDWGPSARQAGEHCDSYKHSGGDSVDPRSHVCVAAHSGDHNHQSGDSPHGDCLYQPFLEHHPTVVHRDRLETCDHLGCRYGVGDSPRACDCRSDVGESRSHDPMIRQTRRLG